MPTSRIFAISSSRSTPHSPNSPLTFLQRAGDAPTYSTVGRIKERRRWFARQLPLGETSYSPVSASTSDYARLWYYGYGVRDFGRENSGKRPL